MWRNRIAAASHISVGDHTLTIGKDVLLPLTAPATLDAPILFVQKGDTTRTDIKGKAIALSASP